MSLRPPAEIDLFSCRWFEPLREIAYVALDVIEPSGILADRIAGRLRHETRTAFLDVPVSTGVIFWKSPLCPEW